MLQSYAEASHTIAAFYDGLADGHVTRTFGPQGIFFNYIELAELASINITGKRILDLGCGAGRVGRFVEGLASFCCGIDLSSKMVQAANRVGLQDNYFACADASMLPFSRMCFDIATSFGLFEYVEDLSPILREVAGVLIERGSFIFTCHSVSGAAFFNHFGVYHRVGHSLHSLREACEAAGFDVITIRPALAGVGALRLSVKATRLLPTKMLRGLVMKIFGIY